MYLETYYNKRLPVNLEENANNIVQQELERIQGQASQILVAMEMPRRLGEDASSGELAREKQRCRRVLHVLRQQLLAWAEKDEKRIKFRPLTNEDKQAGAQLLWTKWWKEHEKYLERRRVYIATWALRRQDEKQFANKSVMRLSQELEQLRHALR